MSLVIKNVRKHFPSPAGGGMVVAVDGASLELRPGDFCAISGPSGSGKTTLLLMAGGLLSPSEGEVSICGMSPYALRAGRRSKLRADKIGFVFQQFHLLPYLSVLENVLAPTLARSADGAELKGRELLRQLRLDHRERHTPGALSVGEQRRVALARALLLSPPILIADEPTGNLDPDNSAIIIATLSAYTATGGVVLMATHDQTALRTASHRLEMRGGRLTSNRAT